MANLKEAFEGLIGDNINTQVELCKVVSVDKDNEVIECEPINENALHIDVAIGVVKGKKTGVLIYPALESLVLVGLENNDSNRGFLVRCSEIESIIIKVSDKFECDIDVDGNVKMKAETIEINEGNNEGVVILPKLKTEIQKNNTHWTTLKNILKTAMPVPSDGGKFVFTQLLAAIDSLELADLSKVGNDKFKH